MTAYHGEVMMKLVDEIMRRTQFEVNKPELELLDNELMEDDVRIDRLVKHIDRLYGLL